MAYGEEYNQALVMHQASLRHLEETLRDLNVDVLAQENIRLSQEKSQLLEQMEELRLVNRQLSQGLAEASRAYKEQMLNEKLNYMNISKRRVRLLFDKEDEKSVNKLNAIEATLTQKMKRTTHEAQGMQGEVKAKYMEEINALQYRMQVELTLLRRKLSDAKTRAENQLEEIYSGPDLTELDQTQLNRLKKGNNVELKLGLNFVNKLGVILVFLAVVLAGRYSYSHWFNDYAKGTVFYVLGLLFCLGGEWLHQRKMPAVAAGITGGGIGLFYASTFISTFYLHILPFNMAMGVSLLIAAASLSLTMRYKSPTIGLLALVGGYLPFFAYVVVYGIHALPVMQAVAYLMLYNGLVLALSVRQKWLQIVYVGFLFNIPCIHYLLSMMDNHLLAIVYAYINFIIYLAAVLYRAIKLREDLNTGDLILISLNSLVNCGMVYGLFDQAGYGEYSGILALIYACLYFALAVFTEKCCGKSAMINIFYAFAVGFSVLVVPLQLSRQWVFFGWLIEACMYIYLGKTQRIKPLEYMGLGLLALSHGAFLVSSGFNSDSSNAYPTISDLKYSAVVASEIFTAWVYWEKGGRADGMPHGVAALLRYPVMVHISLFLAYEVWRAYQTLLSDIPQVGIEVMVIFWGAVLLTNRVYKALKADRLVFLHRYCEISEIAIYAVMIGINFMPLDTAGLRWWADAFLLIGGNCAILWKINSVLAECEGRSPVTREARAVIVGSYGLCVYFINLAGPFRPENFSVVLNLSMIFFSLLYISLGFRHSLMLLRRMGLVLSLLATVKMLIIDSIGFSLPQKIISYFVFGLVLIGISTVYQRISSKMDGIKEDSHGNE